MKKIKCPFCSEKDLVPVNLPTGEPAVGSIVVSTEESILNSGLMLGGNSVPFKMNVCLGCGFMALFSIKAIKKNI